MLTVKDCGLHRQPNSMNVNNVEMERVYVSSLFSLERGNKNEKTISVYCNARYRRVSILPCYVAPDVIPMVGWIDDPIMIIVMLWASGVFEDEKPTDNDNKYLSGD